MARNPWWPNTIAAQVLLLQNFYNKIEQYETALNLTAGQILAIQKVLEDAIATYNFANGCNTSSQGVNAWKREVLSGKPVGAPAPAPPTFPQNAPPNVNKGLLNTFFEFREMIMKQPGFEESIGEDLGIIGSHKTPPSAVSVRPELTTRAVPGFAVALGGSMQGMDALRVEYATGNGSYVTVGFFTKKPGTVHIEPKVAGQPERGRIRAIFIKKDQEYGQFSPNYPVTLS